MFAAEDSGSGFHPVMYEKRSEDHGDRSWGQNLWAIIIVIIFLIIVFFAFALMRDNKQHGGLGSVAEIAALGSLNNGRRADDGVVVADTRAAFTEINGRFDALSQQVNHINDVNDLRDLKSTQAALSLQIANNRTDTLLNFKDLALQTAQGQADINRNIDNTRAENATNTCNIIQNADANTRAILERMFQDENQRLRDELAREREARSRENLAASQAVQNSYLISQIRPYANPTYSVLPPVPANF